MKQTFAAVVLASIVSAGPTKGNPERHLNGVRKPQKNEDRKFAQYCAKYNKDVRDEANFARRQHRFHLNDRIINE